jgi:5'-nucleotidase
MKPTTDFKNMRILVTNDDGIHAPGLRVLEAIARELTDDVWVVAPEVEQSGAGHSLSIHTPLRFQQYHERRYSVKGTPTDCVLYAVEQLLPAHGKKPDLVLSGVNRGNNLGEDVTHSGTIAATMEGTLCGIPSIAFSQAFSMWDPKAQPSWHLAEKHGAEIVRAIMAHGIPPMVLMNVNFPNLPPATEAKGIRMATQGRRAGGKQLHERFDNMGRPYYWVNWGDENGQVPAESDLALVAEGYVTITPIRMDLTDHALLATMRNVLDRALAD